MSPLSKICALLLLAIAAQLYQTATTDEFQRSSYVKHLPSCSLAAFSQQLTTPSEARCKYECLKGECAAYQWHPDSNTCHTQDSLHIATSTAPEDEVGYMMRDPFPLACATDCADILALDPSSESGVYEIFVAGQVLKKVWCDMDTDGGGWTVFVKRLDGSVDFYQDRATYKEGFGDVSAEHWLGLDTLHALTSSKTYQLRADMSDWDDDTAYSLHASMLVGDDAADYILTLGDFLGGDGGDYLLYNQGMRFTTKDRDVDSSSTYNCAKRFTAGWWYKSCSRCHVTGQYYIGGTYSASVNNGMQWRSWSKHLDDHHYSLKTLNIKIRP